MGRFLRVPNLFKKGISPVRLIVSSFFVVILAGTLLLCLPICSRNGQATNIVDSFFVATSCTCVTGLTPFDTYSHWSVLGQVVMIILIQIGGLGPVSFTTGFTLLIKRKMGIRNLQLAQAYTKGNVIDIPKLLKTILFVSFLFEAIGAVLLSFRFIPEFGLRGIWMSIFLAISSYCNAGFDIVGFINPGTSIIVFQNDIFVNIVIGGLIILGGIGFLVISDVYTKTQNKIKKVEFHPHLTVNTKIVLVTTAFLLILGTVLFFFLEYDNTLRGMPMIDKITASFFQSTTARTAGYATVDPALQNDSTKLLMIVLMFIGASPSSTGGGIKTTTVFILIATVVSMLKGYPDTTVRRHRIKKNDVYQAISITALSLLVVLITIASLEFIEASQGVYSIDLMFEAVSAFGTVGLSAGITPILSWMSKIVLCIVMFIGRVGPMSLVIALTLKTPKRAPSVLPEGNIIVG